MKPFPALQALFTPCIQVEGAPESFPFALLAGFLIDKLGLHFLFLVAVHLYKHVRDVSSGAGRREMP